MENIKLTFVDEDEDTHAHCFIDGNRDDGFLIESFEGYKKSNYFTRRLCAAWNVCEGIPTGDLEAGAKKDPSYWRMQSVRNAIDRNIAIEERDKLLHENNNLRCDIAIIKEENSRLRQHVLELGSQP